MKIKVILLLLFIFGCGGKKSMLPDSYEIKDIDTDIVHSYRKEPKLKKSIVYCNIHKENEVVWLDWQVNQIPKYHYRVDSYKNYIERTWVEQHYGYRIAP
tara:strand:- start:405 stop:704 length:300 start_codon:yes stop_codon:yes gene_type:complete